MEKMDEYIYFKDRNSRFLSASRYLAKKCGFEKSQDVLGMTDFDLFNDAHAKSAFSDEKKIANGELKEVNKEESFIWDNEEVRWVTSHKLPLFTRWNDLAGSFGISRDITEKRLLNKQIEETNKAMQAELQMARNLQSALLKQSSSEEISSDDSSTLEFATRYIPSSLLSGDFFKIGKTLEGNTFILLADVMGHGVRAAMVTAMIQIATDQLRMHSDEPTVFMAKLNEIIANKMQPKGEVLFATSIYCLFNQDSGVLRYVQSGGCHGIYLPSFAEETPQRFDRSKIGPALGLIPGSEYVETEVKFKPGDKFFLYTDGIVEAPIKDEEFGETRLLNTLQNHQNKGLENLLDKLIQEVRSFVRNDSFADDVYSCGPSKTLIGKS